MVLPFEPVMPTILSRPLRAHAATTSRGEVGERDDGVGDDELRDGDRRARARRAAARRRPRRRLRTKQVPVGDLAAAWRRRSPPGTRSRESVSTGPSTTVSGVAPEVPSRSAPSTAWAISASVSAITWVPATVRRSRRMRVTPRARAGPHARPSRRDPRTRPRRPRAQPPHGDRADEHATRRHALAEQRLTALSRPRRTSSTHALARARSRSPSASAASASWPASSTAPPPQPPAHARSPPTSSPRGWRRSPRPRRSGWSGCRTAATSWSTPTSARGGERRAGLELRVVDGWTGQERPPGDAVRRRDVPREPRARARPRRRRRRRGRRQPAGDAVRRRGLRLARRAHARRGARRARRPARGRPHGRDRLPRRRAAPAHPRPPARVKGRDGSRVEHARRARRWRGCGPRDAGYDPLDAVRPRHYRARSTAPSGSGSSARCATTIAAGSRSSATRTSSIRRPAAACGRPATRRRAPATRWRC